MRVVGYSSLPDGVPNGHHFGGDADGDFLRRVAADGQAHRGAQEIGPGLAGQQ